MKAHRFYGTLKENRKAGKAFDYDCMGYDARGGDDEVDGDDGDRDAGGDGDDGGEGGMCTNQPGE